MRLSPQREITPKEMEIKVTNVIHNVGVPANIKGYQYLRDAILMTINDNEMINAVTKQLYPEVAKRHKTTSSRVERAIRHAIRGRMHARKRGVFLQALRLYREHLEGQAHKLGVHRPYRG